MMASLSSRKRECRQHRQPLEADEFKLTKLDLILIPGTTDGTMSSSKFNLLVALT